MIAIEKVLVERSIEDRIRDLIRELLQWQIDFKRIIIVDKIQSDLWFYNMPFPTEESTVFFLDAKNYPNRTVGGSAFPNRVQISVDENMSQLDLLARTVHEILHSVGINSDNLFVDWKWSAKLLTMLIGRTRTELLYYRWLLKCHRLL